MVRNGCIPCCGREVRGVSGEGRPCLGLGSQVASSPVSIPAPNDNHHSDGPPGSASQYEGYRDSFNTRFRALDLAISCCLLGG